MYVMYNSENYCVVEFAGRHGIELVDKTTGRAGFSRASFRASRRECFFSLSTFSSAALWRLPLFGMNMCLQFL